MLETLFSVFLFVLKEVSQHSDMVNKIIPIELPTNRTTFVPVVMKVYYYSATLEMHLVKQEIVLINLSFKDCREFD